MEYLISLIKKIFSLNLPMSLTINFDGNGGYKLETKLHEKATNGIFEKIN